MGSPLKDRIIKSIKAEGPMNVAAYMATCLMDPVNGFYATRDPLGSEGDFITAPEISQMFGEMLGLWCIQTWRDLGSPDSFNLIELGPGRGVMMLDILRAARIDKDFLRAAEIHLLEASPALQAVQAKTLSASPSRIIWADKLEDIPQQPTILLANEFLDCLPIRQFVGKDGKWHERLVAIHPENETELIFALSPLPYEHDEIAHFGRANEGELAEFCPSYAQIINEIRMRLWLYPGRALLIDYGPEKFETGDTLQAIAKHQKVDPLLAPGEADITARVDFSHLLHLARKEGLTAHGPQPQVIMLSELGIEQRAKMLAKTQADKGNSQAGDKIARQLSRLTAPEEMGQLFKAISLQSKTLLPPPGFSFHRKDLTDRQA